MAFFKFYAERKRTALSEPVSNGVPVHTKTRGASEQHVATSHDTIVIQNAGLAFKLIKA